MKSLAKQFRIQKVHGWSRIRYSVNKYLITKIYNVFYKPFEPIIIKRWVLLYNKVSKYHDSITKDE